MPQNQLPIDQVVQGDCLQVLETFPPESVDLVFADPPYNLQLQHELLRPDQSKVSAVDDSWDHFDDFQSYDRFSEDWLRACRRVLKPTGTLWVIGSYHNIYRVGYALQNLGYWILNDVVWIKNNPMPNFRGVRFTNAHETLIWAQKQRGQRYTFNHHAMKALNDGLQMRSDWDLPICTGRERLHVNGAKAHSTQKPRALLYRVLEASSNPGDVVLDPFFGTGTTGEVARQLNRHWIGIERDPDYVQLASQRIEAVAPAMPNALPSINPRREPRLPFGALLENGLLTPGQALYLGAKGDQAAIVQADGCIVYDGVRGSIHGLARQFHAGSANGWQTWFYLDPQTNQRLPIDHLRQFLKSVLNEAQ